jgi:predicted nucleic acid-binding protein
VAEQKAAPQTQAGHSSAAAESIWTKGHFGPNHPCHPGRGPEGTLKAYADSSFIVALYLPQQSSAKAIAFVERYGRALPFTPWHRLEVRNALRLAVFQGVIDPFQCKTQLNQLETDLKDEMLLIHAAIDWTDVLRCAEKLGKVNTQTIGCRSADLFHVATAKATGHNYFLTFDEKQAALARKASLAVK